MFHCHRCPSQPCPGLELDNLTINCSLSVWREQGAQIYFPSAAPAVSGKNRYSAEISKIVRIGFVWLCWSLDSDFQNAFMMWKSIIFLKVNWLRQRSLYLDPSENIDSCHEHVKRSFIFNLQNHIKMDRLLLKIRWISHPFVSYIWNISFAISSTSE